MSGFGAVGELAVGEAPSASATNVNLTSRSLAATAALAGMALSVNARAEAKTITRARGAMIGAAPAHASGTVLVTSEGNASVDAALRGSVDAPTRAASHATGVVGIAGYDLSAARSGGHLTGDAPLFGAGSAHVSGAANHIWAFLEAVAALVVRAAAHVHSFFSTSADAEQILAPWEQRVITLATDFSPTATIITVQAEPNTLTLTYEDRTIVVLPEDTSIDQLVEECRGTTRNRIRRQA